MARHDGQLQTGWLDLQVLAIGTYHGHDDLVLLGERRCSPLHLRQRIPGHGSDRQRVC